MLSIIAFNRTQLIAFVIIADCVRSWHIELIRKFYIVLTDICCLKCVVFLELRFTSKLKKNICMYVYKAHLLHTYLRFLLKGKIITFIA